MLFPTASHFLGAALSLSAIVHAAAIPELEERATDSTCRRLDVRIASKIVSSYNAEAICANYLPTATKSVKKLSAARGVSGRDFDHGDLETRTFKLPTALKRYKAALLTQTCKCLFPPAPVEVTYNYIPTPQPWCLYEGGYKSTISTTFATGGINAANDECQAGCTAEGDTCGFFVIFVKYGQSTCVTNDEGDAVCVSDPPVATCYYSHSYDPSGWSCDRSTSGGYNRGAGYEKVKA